MDSGARFVHRGNWDGTYDSVCMRCFVTVAAGDTEDELEQGEREHVCDPWLVTRFEQAAREQ